MLRLYYDALQEGQWLSGLDPRFEGVPLLPFEHLPSSLHGLLSYDKPDVIVCDDEIAVLVLERTVEVPSGHNVGQRFARLLAAAKARTPCLLVAPFKAMKHGGETSGPRYVNLRLFDALDKVSLAHDTFLAAINWPVDEDCEIIRGDPLNAKVAPVVRAVLDLYGETRQVPRKNDIVATRAARGLAEEIAQARATAPRRYVYAEPPPSVKIAVTNALRNTGLDPAELPSLPEAVVYRIGMKTMRADPYTGMAVLYDYLYARNDDGSLKRVRILHMPNILRTVWEAKARYSRGSKEIRLYVEASDAILFFDSALITASASGTP